MASVRREPPGPEDQAGCSDRPQRQRLGLVHRPQRTFSTPTFFAREFFLTNAVHFFFLCPQLSAAEGAKIVKAFGNPSDIIANGIVIGGQKYFALRYDDRSLYGKKVIF